MRALRTDGAVRLLQIGHPIMLDYDTQAPCYDRTRGGPERARAAAKAVAALLPADIQVVVDIAGGTGLVGQAMKATGRAVVVADASAGMLSLAATRHPGRVIRCDARRLPLATGSVDAISSVWLLHLLKPPGVVAVVGEVARALRPGGVWVTTVDKRAAHLHEPIDLQATDTLGRLLELAARQGLAPAGTAAFVGFGQGRKGVGDGSDPVFPLLALRKP